MRSAEAETFTAETWYAVGKDVILPDCRLLLLAGFVVKPMYLRKLEAFKVEYVYVEEGYFEPIDELEEERLYSHAAATIKSIFAMTSRNRDTEHHTGQRYSQ